LAGIAGAGSYANSATARADAVTDTAGHSEIASATDGSSYVGADAEIHIDKKTTGFTTPTTTVTGDGISILAGYGVTWTYTVTDAGNVPLSNVKVFDSQSGVTPGYVSGDTNLDGKLETTETWIYQATGTAITGNYNNTGTATGQFADTAGHTKTASASDGSSYNDTFTPGTPGLTIGYWFNHQSVWYTPPPAV